MKLRYLTLLIFLVGCKSGMITQKSSMNIPDREFSSSYAGTENNIPYYSSNEFTNNALKSYTLDYLKSAFAGKNETSKTPVDNLHDNSIVDTIYHFSDNSNEIEYYKGTHANFITKFDVTDSQYDLYGGISAGTRKDDFTKAFNIENKTGDVVNIGNASQTAIYTFYFRNNKIQRISSLFYID
ncbi:hypothetical protein [Draconibacterium halophilum]|uniref:Uncharacterized protein n=1 Tax=Draconibacterium halophilum TaxID=2706887 RepID=A0A6C0RJI2_9BACT|nr:hypothetical protein [Draconibacterium halophilum]QIA09331.1 hypothetical protein G0Q07_17175 [Draconibacterium halophilum]